MVRLVALAVSAVMLTVGGGIGMDRVMRHDVTVVVDGVSREVVTSSPTVAGVLIGHGVTLGEHDVVNPDPSQAVVDGQRIEVRYGRQVTISVDGVPTTFWTTARTVADALSQLDVRSQKYEVSTSRSTAIGREGLRFAVDTYVNVRVVAGGTSRQVRASGTVNDALVAANVDTDADDKISQDDNLALTEGMTITVVKVDTKTTTKTSKIPHGTTTHKSSSVAQGSARVTVTGKDGTKTETVQIRYEDGKQVSTSVLSSKVTVHPVTEVKVVGTGPPTSITSANGSTCGASYYTTGSVTANGEAFNTNDFTAAHKTLPFGTRVKVTNTTNGKTTIVRINDRGPFVVGRCLDLSRAAMSAVGGISSGVITVEYEVI